jgi:hypothetical protein
MGTYAGIDLHSSNSYIGIIDEQDRRQFGKRLPNSLTQILVVLEPFKKNLEAVVELVLVGGWITERGIQSTFGQSISRKTIRGLEAYRRQMGLILVGSHETFEHIA